jgi:hypothetical protein
MQNDRPGLTRRFGTLVCILHSAFCIRISAITQDDVFKSIKENVSESEGGGRRLLIVLLGLIAIVLMLVALSARRKTDSAGPRALHHPGKLLKEVSRQIPLRPAELKQLKLLAHAHRDDAGRPVDNPLVLLLCPSALVAAMRASRATRVDRKVMTSLARKLGLIAKK